MHSYLIEVEFTANKLDNGGMIVDFGIMKDILKTIIDSWDHTHSIWTKDDPEYIADCKMWSARWIETKLSPSAECMALMFLTITDVIIKNTLFANNEGNVEVYSVKVHETTTGYAQAFREDLTNPEMPTVHLEDIVFSDQIKKEWSDPELWDKLINNDKFILDKPLQQVES